MAKHKRHHHQGAKDRLAESRGEERHLYRKHAMEEGHYAGAEPRRRQELEDAGMIHEDHAAIANLPQNVVMRPYPKPDGYMPEVLDDTIRGIDKQMDMDDNKRRKHFMPKKV